MMKSTTLEIRAVKNGFIALPISYNQNVSLQGDTVHVFETFQALVEWLDIHLKKPEMDEESP